jgi:hypothetical protein
VQAGQRLPAAAQLLFRSDVLLSARAKHCNGGQYNSSGGYLLAIEEMISNTFCYLQMWNGFEVPLSTSHPSKRGT